MKNKLSLYLFLFTAVSSVFFTSCIKNDIAELGNAGKTFLKILEAPENKIFFEPFSGTRTVSLLSLRRDANSSEELSKTVIVNVLVDTAAIRAYNTMNGTNFKLLPDSLFTLVGSGITKTGNLTYQVTFAPGEFAKEFLISLNGSKWNLAEKYAMPLRITDPGGLTISSGMNSAIALISIKNKYDGVYEYTATYDLPADRSAAWLRTEWTYPYDVHLQTAGPSTVSFFNTLFGAGFLPLAVGPGAYSGFGGTGPVITFDANDMVISITNPAATATNRQFSLIPGGNSRYDAASKTLYLEMFMTQNGFLPIPMHIRMKYLKPR